MHVHIGREKNKRINLLEPMLFFEGAVFRLQEMPDISSLKNIQDFAKGFVVCSRDLITAGCQSFSIVS